MAQKNRSRTRKSNSVLVGIVAFFLGFLFALIVLFGSLFGVGYVVATTDINKVLGVLGLENKNSEYDETDPDSNKYNYINADQAPNLYSLITEIIAMANDGLGEINLDRISALAPVTDAVLDLGYAFIDGVVDFDKEFFEGVPLTSVLDTITNSVNYVHTGKIIDTVNSQFGASIDLSEVPIAGYMIDGIEADYASVPVMGENFRLPVLYDYYVEDGSSIGYGRTVSVNGICAFPDNLNGDTSYIQETSLTDEDGKKLYKVYYVPCKITPTGIEEADYIVKKLTVEDSNISFTKDGDTYNLKYVFRVIEFGEDTDFIAVKPDGDGGSYSFTLDYGSIIAARNPDASADASNRYLGYSYYDAYARNYYSGPSKRAENGLVYGVTTINNINFFKDNDGNVIEYDPLLVSDVVLDPMETLNHVPVYSVVNTSQTEMVREIFGDTSLGDVLSQNVNFNELVDDILLSAFIDNVSPDDKIMTFLVYNLTDVKEENGSYTAVYDKDGANTVVNLDVAGGVIKGLTDAETGKTVKGNTVSDISSLTDDLTLDVFIDVKADDTIMMYLGYGVTDIYKVTGNEYAYIGAYNDRLVYIYADADGNIDRIVTEGGAELDGTKINDVSDRVSNIMNVLSLPDFMDIDPEESILAYLGYGIYDVEAQSGTYDGREYNYIASYDYNGNTIAAYVAAEEEDGQTRITAVWSENGNVAGTKIDAVSDRLDSITDVLTITDFLDIDPSDAIMLYIGYGVNECVAANGTDSLGNGYAYTCKYTPDGEETAFECYISVNGEGNADEIWYIADGAKQTVKGTKISAISDRVNKLQDTLTIGEIITVDEDSSKMLQAIKDTTISGLDDRINELRVCDVLSEEQIADNSVLPQLRNTLITELGTEIDKVLIQRIYAKDIYKLESDADPEEAVEFNAAYLYYELDETTGAYGLTEIGCDGLEGTDYDNALGKLTQDQWDNRGDKKYYTYGEAKGMWKLILYRTENGVKTEKAYSINNFNNMVSACSTTVYNSTLGELKEAGIIDANTSLDKYLKTGVDESGTVSYLVVKNGSLSTTTDKNSATQMQDLTLKELLDFVTKYVASE